MFRLMLTCHPNIVVPPEGTFALDLASTNGHAGTLPAVEDFVTSVLAHPKMELWGLDREELIEHLHEQRPDSLRGLCAEVYRFYGLQMGKRDFIWGDKNNTYLNSIRLLGRLYPDALFLHIVRDGRDVVCSYRALGRVPGKYAPRLPQSIAGASLNWGYNVDRIRRGFDAVGWDRVHEVRYVDLVRNPVRTLQGVAQFLGLEFSPDMLTFDQKNREAQLEPAEFDAWKAATKRPLTVASVERWRRELTPSDVSVVEYLVGRLLRTYSYKLVGEPLDLRTKSRLEAYRMQFCWRMGRRAMRRVVRRIRGGVS